MIDALFIDVSKRFAAALVNTFHGHLARVWVIYLELADFLLEINIKYRKLFKREMVHFLSEYHYTRLGPLGIILVSI